MCGMENESVSELPLIVLSVLCRWFLVPTEQIRLEKEQKKLHSNKYQAHYLKHNDETVIKCSVL